MKIHVEIESYGLEFHKRKPINQNLKHSMGSLDGELW